MKKKRKKWTRDEVIRICIERPVYAYFHFGIGIWYDVKKNLMDLIRGVEDLLDAICYIGLCVLMAFFHFVQIVFYPITKALSLMDTRKRVRNSYDRMVREGKEKAHEV